MNMPALHNPRHERFARAWIRTGIASEAYRRAGYKVDKPRSVWTAASRMLRHEHVDRRIRELKKQMAARNRITVDSLVEELDVAMALALRIDQPSAAISASMSKARLVGLLIDKREVGGAGDFAASSAQDVIDRVRAELGDATADALAATLAQQDTRQADVEPELEPEPIAPSRAPGDTLN